MRLVRFEDESGGFAIDLHPLVTVISGVPLHVRERLVHALAAIPKGSDPGGHGSIEVHGVFLDLNRESLELLELNQDLDVVLRASDLPGEDPVDEAPAASAPSAFDHLTTGRHGDDLSTARSLVDQHDEAHRAALDVVASIRAQLRDIDQEQSTLSMQLDAARAGLDPSALAAVEDARAELARIDQLASRSADTEPQQPSPPSPPEEGAEALTTAEIEERLTVLIDEADRLKRQLRTLRAIDPEPVRRAFQDLDLSAPTVAEAQPGVEELIADWRRWTERKIAFDARQAVITHEPVELIAKRDAAIAEFEEAERSLESPRPDPAAVERLETIHDEIFELDGRTSKLSAGKIRRRLEVLRDAERDALASLGFDSWSAYVMGVSGTTYDLVAQSRFDRAREAVELAEAELAKARTEAPSVDPEAEEIEAARAHLTERSAAFLGEVPTTGPDDVVAALQALRPAVSETSTRGDSTDSVEALRRALVETGTDLPDHEMTPTELRSIAAGWLEAMESLPARILEVQAIQDQGEEEISRLAVLLDFDAPKPTPAATPPVSPAPNEASSDELAEAKARLAAAEQLANAHNEASAAIAELSERQQRLSERSNDLQFSLADGEARVAEQVELATAARNRYRRAESDQRPQETIGGGHRLTGVSAEPQPRGIANAEAVEWYVLARLAQQRSVSFVGSVPLVIDDAFAGWPVEALGDVFARLERMGEVIQIVYLTDDPEVGAWARSIGAEKARVLDMRVAH